MTSRLLLMILLLTVGMGHGWAADEHAPSHWGYEGEEGTAHWGMLGSAYMACEAGSHQSPINISMPRHSQQQERLVFHYLGSNSKCNTSRPDGLRCCHANKIPKITHLLSRQHFKLIADG